MTEVRIRGVPDHVVDALEPSAAAKRTSLQRYLRDLLEIEADFVISAEERAEWMEPFSSPGLDRPDNVVALTSRGRGQRS